MNTYEKLTVASFTSKLQSGDYASLAGARRAIGKAQDMSTNDKNKAREAADKYFNGGATPKPKAAAAPAKKAPVKKAAAPKPEKVKAAPVKKAAPRAKKPEAAQARAPRGRPKGRPTTRVAPAPAQEAAPTVPEKVSQAQSNISLANQAIQTVSSALTAIKECKAIYPNLDMSSGQRAADALLKTIDFVTNSVAPVFPKPEVPAPLESPNGVVHESSAPELAATQ